MSATDAFAQLGGRPGSGYNGIQAGPTKSYDFPIRGTGNPDDVTDDSTIWWEVCVLHGRVVSKHRGRMGDLPDCR
jgi:hypothetical protein